MISTEKNTKTDDLVEWIETIQYIENDSNSIEDIISVLSNVLDDKSMRTVIRKGIRSYSQDTNNENIGSSIHKQLISSQLQNKKTKQNDTDKKMDSNHLRNQLQVFRISDVACHIFKYLDLKSRLRAKTVNLLWLYNACNPASYYHLNLNDFIRYNYDSYSKRCTDVYINTAVYICGEKELTKLIKKSNGNIKKLTLCQWPDDNAQLFASMANRFTQIESMEITMNEEEYIKQENYFVFQDFLDKNYPNVVSNLLSNNRESITDIKISGFNDFDMHHMIHNMFKSMQKLLFSQLSCLTIDCPLETLPIDISQSLWCNHCNLKTVKFKYVPSILDYDFYKNLTQNETLLSNIETLMLHEINYYNNMLPAVIAKMTNITNVDFRGNVSIEIWIDILSKIPQASTIKSLTLRQNSNAHFRKKKTHGLRFIQQDDNHHHFNKLEKFNVKSDNDVSILHGIFEIVFKSNTILNIQQLIVECSANVLVTDLLNIDDSDSKSRKIGLPNLKYIKCKKIRDRQTEGEKDNMIQAMKNISQWLDLLHTAEYHGKNKVRSFDLGSTNNCDQFCHNIDGEHDSVGHDRIKNGCKGEKKLGKFAEQFLKQLFDLTKNDNVDCTWFANKTDMYDYDFDVMIQQMKQLNMVSSSDIKHYTVKASSCYCPSDREFDCYSLFSQRICFQQDDHCIKIVAKSNCCMHMS